MPVGPWRLLLRQGRLPNMQVLDTQVARPEASHQKAFEYGTNTV
jgi:hypothetical protein